MAYISKITFNIDGTIIHLTLSIPLNCKHLPSLTSKNLNILSKTHSDFNLLVLDEISFIGNKIFSFIDYRLRAIKRTYHHFFGNLDIIIIGDLHQVPLTRDSWVFKPKWNSLNCLAKNFWFNHIWCYELHQVMQQTYEQFVNILNRFRTSTHTKMIYLHLMQYVLKCPQTTSNSPTYITQIKPQTYEMNMYFDCQWMRVCF